MWDWWPWSTEDPSVDTSALLDSLAAEAAAWDRLALDAAEAAYVKELPLPSPMVTFE